MGATRPELGLAARLRAHGLGAIRLGLSRKVALLGAAGMVVGVLFWAPLPKGPNLGLPFGYYGKFNSIKREIENRPGMEIVEIAMHRDLTLEDFWITVRRPDGSEVELAFVNANIRSRADLRRELEHLANP